MFTGCHSEQQFARAVDYRRRIAVTTTDVTPDSSSSWS